jgi:Skp family chaperone for outer membrane proteins
MNLRRLTGLVIFVLLFSIASHSLTSSAFAINTSHEKVKTPGFSDPDQINVKVPKDKSVEAKVKEAKAKAEAEINHLKDIAKSKLKGYSE